MKVYLKKNWSEQFIYGDESPGYFVGRKKEIDSLKNIISANDSGSILISSVRGVGKTSFIHKALSEIKDLKKEISPIFVNIGHALSNGDINDKEKESKKLLLKSLIRAIRFNKKFQNNKELDLIYKKSLGYYKEKESEEEESTEDKKIEASLKLNGKELLSLFLTASLIIINLINNLWTRIILTLVGTSGFFLTFYWKKNWTKKIFNKKETIIDNSIEYLEISFEEWLKNLSRKQKIIFIIDELDKIPERDSFRIIKEFKNLFTRSFTHFIFISSQEAFELINENREDSEKGIFPTLFTHVFYLPLPNSSELREYLDQIFEKNENNIDQDIKSYLLFKAKNDFFELKRLLLDFIQHDEDGPFLNIEQIKAEDSDFEEIVKLYCYIDFSMQKYLKDLKKYWKDNSLLQKDFFNFANEKLNINFSENDLNQNQILLKDLLFRAEIIQESGHDENNIITYSWTHNYLIKTADDLFDEEKMFISNYEKNIKVANDLDDIPEKYINNDFTDYNKITEGRDGNDVSGINLFFLYQKYNILYQKLKNKDDLINIKLEESKKATEEIKQNIDNVYKNYLQIFKNLLNKILENDINIFKGENLSVNNFNIHGAINQFPEFLTNLSNIENIVYGKNDQTKYVFVIRDFSNFEAINEGLRALRNNKNILFINLLKGEKAEKKPVILIEDVKRKREVIKREVKIDNFVNYTFSDFRDLSQSIKDIKNFLS